MCSHSATGRVKEEFTIESCNPPCYIPVDSKTEVFSDCSVVSVGRPRLHSHASASASASASTSASISASASHSLSLSLSASVSGPTDLECDVQDLRPGGHEPNARAQAALPPGVAEPKSRSQTEAHLPMSAKLEEGQAEEGQPLTPCVRAACPPAAVPGWKKWGALFIFALQSAGSVLLMRYSKLQHGPAYSNLAAVMMQELVKLGVSTVRPPPPTSSPPHSAHPRASDLPPLHRGSPTPSPSPAPHPHPR